MEKWLVTPPIVFSIMLLVCLALSRVFSLIAFKPKAKEMGEGEPYACGEDNYDHLAQPDYSNFFPFAFFFTLAHVATLIMTTVPTETLEIFVMAALYILGAVVGLIILLRN